MELTQLTIDAARSAIQQRTTSALALAESHYARIQEEDGEIGAYLTLSKERALEQVDRIDRMAAEGKPLPPLAGIPVGIEDAQQVHSALRLHSRGAHGSGRRSDSWQDQLRRICDGFVERELGVLSG